MKLFTFCFLFFSLSACSGQKKLCKDFIKGNEDSLSGIKVVQKDDSVIEIFKMKNGLKNGIYTAYSSDGIIMSIGRYKKDKEIGTWYWYSPSGEIYMAKKYKGGKTYIYTYSTSAF